MKSGIQSSEYGTKRKTFPGHSDFRLLDNFIRLWFILRQAGRMGTVSIITIFTIIESLRQDYLKIMI